MDSLISVNYVKDWTVENAVRELLQNAIDAAPFEVGTGWIHSSKQLELDALLMGESTKTADQLGKFGEGLKLAMLVLIRNGYTVQISSGHHVIIPTLQESFNGKTTMQYRIMHADTYHEGCTIATDLDADWYQYLLPEPTRVRHLDEPKLYIGGLFICDLKGFKFGYNLAPNTVPLGRDRNVVSEFDLAWETSSYWACRQTGNHDMLARLLLDPDCKDLTYLYNHKLDSKTASAFSQTFTLMSNRPYGARMMAEKLGITKSKEYKLWAAWFELNKKHMRRHARVAFLAQLEKL